MGYYGFMQNKLNIVIPVLNNAASLKPLLNQLSGFKVIVVDGGSQDESVSVAKDGGAEVFATKACRGHQLAFGASRTRLEWLLFLHADSQLIDGWQQAVYSFIESPKYKIAVFKFKLDDDRARARFWELVANNLRCKLFGLAYGDQGLIIHRNNYLKSGGFSDDFMEDVSFIKKFKRHEICFLDVPLITSAVRFRKNGYLLQTIKNIFLLLLYFFGVAPKKLARFYK